MRHVGEVAAIPLPGGGFGAAQVSGFAEEYTTAFALDFYSDELPDLAAVGDAGPLLSDHGVIDAINIGSIWPEPLDLAWLGNQPLREGAPVTSNSFSAWEALAYGVHNRRRWASLPEAARTAWARAVRTQGDVLVDFGVARKWLRTTVGRLDLRDLPETGEVDWTGLNVLPRVTMITWQGPDRGLVADLRRRPTVFNLIWHDPPSTVDLTGTAVENLELHGDRVTELSLPVGAVGLRIGSPARVTARDDGRLIRVVVDGPSLPTGLDRLRWLHWEVAGEADAASLGGLPELGALTIRWTKPPGTLGHPEVLGGLRSLKTLKIIDGYGIRPAELPGLDGVGFLEFDGIRRSAAKPLKARFPGVRIRGAKADTWIAANLENPLRDWVDDHERAGQQACKAYARALKTIGEDPQAALRVFVEELNAVEQRYGIIDTLRREEAGDVFMDLAAKAGIGEQAASDWFDDWRDF